MTVTHLDQNLARLPNSIWNDVVSPHKSFLSLTPRMSKPTSQNHRHENSKPVHAGPNTGTPPIRPTSSPAQTTTKPAANQRRHPNPSSGILAEIGGSRFGVERIGSFANEDLEMSLGSQNPVCCDWDVEGAKRGLGKIYEDEILSTIQRRG